MILKDFITTSHSRSVLIAAQYAPALWLCVKSPASGKTVRFEHSDEFGVYSNAVELLLSDPHAYVELEADFDNEATAFDEMREHLLKVCAVEGFYSHLFQIEANLKESLARFCLILKGASKTAIYPKLRTRIVQSLLNNHRQNPEFLTQYDVNGASYQIAQIGLSESISINLALPYNAFHTDGISSTPYFQVKSRALARGAEWNIQILRIDAHLQNNLIAVLSSALQCEFWNNAHRDPHTNANLLCTLHFLDKKYPIETHRIRYSGDVNFCFVPQKLPFGEPIRPLATTQEITAQIAWLIRRFWELNAPA